MDRIESMRAFVRVVELGGFTPAARSLALSPSMVTKHIDAIEERIGVRLLSRSTRAVRPSEAGLLYYERCVALLAAMEEADNEAASTVQRPAGTLRITSPVEFGNAHLSALVAEMMALYPELAVKLDYSNRVVNLVEEGYDLAVRIAGTLDGSLVGRRIASSAMHVVASPALLAKEGRPERPEDLERFDALCFGIPTPWERWTFRHGGNVTELKVRSRMVSTSAEALRLAAREGAGVSLLPSFVCGRDLAEGHLVSLFPDHDLGSLGIHALYPDRQFLPARVRLFIDLLVTRFGGGDSDPWTPARPR